jgi:hypothetical protein
MQQFDPENREHDLFNLWDQEIIQFGGSPIFYYEVFIQKNTVDPLYREDRGKIWSNNPVQLYTYYDPIASQNYMNMWGMDGPDDIKFEFNYRSVLKALGHPPKIGSRLFTPHKRENWVIVQRAVGEFKMWGELHLVLMCQRFQESLTDGSGKPIQKQPDFKLNEGSLLR